MAISTELIIKNLVVEYLETTKVFDRLLQDYKSLHSEVSDYKKSTPDASLLDYKDRILDLLKVQQKGALIMRDAEAYLNRLAVLKTIAGISNIDLGLSEEDADLLNRVSKSVNIFFTSRNGNLVELQPEVIAEFTRNTSEKYGSDIKVQEIFNKL
jgi:hypothetical protein